MRGHGQLDLLERGLRLLELEDPLSMQTYLREFYTIESSNLKSIAQKVMLQDSLPSTYYSVETIAYLQIISNIGILLKKNDRNHTKLVDNLHNKSYSQLNLNHQLQKIYNNL